MVFAASTRTMTPHIKEKKCKKKKKKKSKNRNPPAADFHLKRKKRRKREKRKKKKKKVEDMGCTMSYAALSQNLRQHPQQVLQVEGINGALKEH
jgi:hypothetical protein